MKMGNILSKQKTRQSFAAGAVGIVSGNGANYLSTKGGVNVDYRAATNTIDSHTINEVCPTCGLVSADVATEKAKLIRLYRGIPKPPDLRANWDRVVERKQRESGIREWELVFLKKDNG